MTGLWAPGGPVSKNLESKGWELSQLGSGIYLCCSFLGMLLLV